MHHSGKNERGIFGGFVRNSSFQLATNFATMGAAFLQTLLLARYLGVENYGILALLMTWTECVGQFVSFNMWEIMTKYGSDFVVSNKRRELLALTKFAYLAELVTGILAGCICLGAASIASRLFIQAPAGTTLFILYIPILVLNFLDNTSNAILRIHARFKMIAARDICIVFSRLLTLWIILSFYPTLTNVLLVLLFYSVLLTLFNLILSARILPFSWSDLVSVKISVLKEHRRGITAFMRNNYFSQCWSVVLANSDVLFLGYFRGPGDVGIYKMGKNFYNILVRFVEPFYLVIYPDLAKLWVSRSYAYFFELIKSSTVLLASIFVLLTLAVTLCVPYFIRFSVGLQYMNAVLPARLLLCGACIAGIFFWTRPAILAMGKTHIPTIVNFLGMVLVILLSFFIIPLYGATGTAFIFVVPIILGNVTISFYVYRAYAAMQR